jgi:hypothetical protein
MEGGLQGNTVFIKADRDGSGFRDTRRIKSACGV